MNTAARLALLAKVAAAPAMAGLTPYWREAPQSAPLPVIRVSLVSSLRGASHAGSDGLDEVLVQIDVFDDDPADAETLRDAILDELHGFSGEVSGVRFDSIFHDDSRDDRDPEGTHLAGCDLRITYQL